MNKYQINYIQSLIDMSEKRLEADREDVRKMSDTLVGPKMLLEGLIIGNEAKVAVLRSLIEEGGFFREMSNW